MSFKTTPRVLPLLLLLAATILTSDAGAAEKYESTFTSQEMVLDGDPIDWQGIPIIYLEDSLHVMSIVHDDHNLYLIYRFANERLARQLMIRGVTLWISGNGKTTKKKEEFAVRYPGSKQISEHLESEENTDGGDGGRRSPDAEIKWLSVTLPPAT